MLTKAKVCSSLRVSPLKILTKGSAFGNRKPLKRLDLNFMFFLSKLKYKLLNL